MSFMRALLRKPPNLEDIDYFVRALLTRPGDIPGILRREAARRRAGHQERPDDQDGLFCLIAGWEAALTAGVFEAPPGEGGPSQIDTPIDDVAGALSALQTASALSLRGACDDRLTAAVAFEAARLSLGLVADDPTALASAQRAFLRDAAISDRLRARLEALIADQEATR